MSSTADSTSGFGETSRFVMFKSLAVVASKRFRVVCTYRESSPYTKVNSIGSFANERTEHCFSFLSFFVS